MKLKGYTLSEVMIALLVLGTIIACCMPIISNMAPNKNAIMLKKAYFTTQQIINDLVNDDSYYPNGNLREDTGEVTVHGTNITTSGDNKFPCLFASKLNLDTSMFTLEHICQDFENEGISTVEGLVLNMGAINFVEDTTKAVDDPERFIARMDLSVTNNPSDSQYNLGDDACIDPTYFNGWGANACGTTTHINKIGKIAMFINPDGKLSLQTTNNTYAGAFDPNYGGPNGHNVAQQNILDIITGKTSLLGKPKN